MDALALPVLADSGLGDVTVGQGVAAGTVLAVGVALAVLLRLAVTRAFRGDDSSPSAALLIARFVQLLIVAAAVLYAMTSLGVRISPLLGALGIGGIAVALAVQSVLANAIASVILQVRRPFRRGDQVQSNDLEGIVLDVNLRTVQLRTFDGNDVLIPAAQVLESPITNFTRRPSRRTTLEVGVDYATDLEAARAVLLGAVAGVAGVFPEPPPEAWVTAFGDNAITVALRWWHDPANAVLWRVRSDVAIAVKRDLDAAGMVIAFPQRVVHLAPAES